MYKIAIEKPTQEKLDALGVFDWGIWEKEKSIFDWSYDSDETCYILEGKARVKTEWEEVTFEKGDLVKFPKGLSCTWIKGLRSNDMTNLAEPILERNKERRVPRIPCDTQAMSDAVAAQKRPAPSGRHIFGRLFRCSSLTYRIGYVSVVTPYIRLKPEPPNLSYCYLSIPLHYTSL